MMRVQIDEAEFDEPEPGMGMPVGWGVFARGASAAPIPDPLPLSERCEACVLLDAAVWRCWLARGHEGHHAIRY